MISKSVNPPEARMIKIDQPFVDKDQVDMKATRLISKVCQSARGSNEKQLTSHWNCGERSRRYESNKIYIKIL